MGGSFFFFSFFSSKWDFISLHCTKFTLGRVRATIQSLGEQVLWGLNASSEQHLGRAAPNLPIWLHTVLKWGSTNDFVSRWAADESGVVLLCPPELCLPKQRNAWHTSKPAAVSSPELAAWNCAFVGLPSRVRVGWLCWTLSFWLLSLWETVGATTAKRANWPIQERESQWCAFYFAFSVPRALQQQAIKQNSFPLNWIFLHLMGSNF